SSNGTTMVSMVPAVRRSPSLVSECLDRVYASCPTRREVAGHERDRAQERRHGDEAQRVERRDAEQQRSEESRHAKRAAEADRDADAAEKRAVADDEPEDVATLRAERDANADLLRSLGHRVRDDAVDTDRGEHERDGGEYGEHLPVERLLPIRLLDARIHAH